MPLVFLISNSFMVEKRLLLSRYFSFSLYRRSDFDSLLLPLWICLLVNDREKCCKRNQKRFYLKLRLHLKPDIQISNIWIFRKQPHLRSSNPTIHKKPLLDSRSFLMFQVVLTASEPSEEFLIPQTRNWWGIIILWILIRHY